MNWKNVTTEESAKELMNVFGGFHDACIREAHLFSQHFVNDELTMNCTGDLDTSVQIVVHRQFRNPACIELLFEGVTRLNFVPSPDNYDSVIYEAKVGLENGEIYWSIDIVKPPSQCKANYDTWICSKSLKWRARDEYLGAELHFGNNT